MRISNFLVIASLALSPALFAEDPTERLDSAADVLHDMMHMDDKGVPQDLIDHAQCVVVVPGLKKAAFIVGGKYGRGFAVCRKEDGAGWSAPAAIRIEGGSVGFQIGGSEQDVIMIVKSKSGENKLLQDKFTLGGDATVAAGPLGRDLTAQTDAQLHAEILSYSRSRGLFAGISLTGATLRPDKDGDHDLYGRGVTTREILSGTVAPPAAAARFENMLNRTSMEKNG